jgi:hypothetical protein
MAAQQKRLPDWLEPPDPNPTIFVTVEIVITKNQNKKATEIDLFVMTKWLESTFPG